MAASRWTWTLALWLAWSQTGCPRPPSNGGVAGGGGEAPADLPAVDTSSLTPRELREWEGYVTELLAPCEHVAASIAECVREDKPCPACLPAARYLVDQVRSGRPKAQVLDLFDSRFDPGHVRTIVVGDSATQGPLDAPVTIVEFADFECPSCRLMSGVLEQVRAHYPRDVLLVYKHFPISYHPNSELAARAAVAAQKQGRFWEMHHMLFDHPDEQAEPDLLRYAAGIGLDVERFRADLNAEHVRRQVARERAQGEGLGVKGTPTLYVNGREVPLRALDDPVRDLEQWVAIELELVRASAPRPASPAPVPSTPDPPQPAPAAAATTDPPDEPRANEEAIP